MPIYNLTFISQQTVARDTIEYTFEKPDNFNFIPGQYGGFTLVDHETNTPVTRRFSLLNARDEPHIRITTRIQPSPFKKCLLALKPLDTIKFAGPTGNFTLHEDATIPAIFIAGGIGVTPFYSILADAKLRSVERPFTLFYGNNTEADAAYFEELKAYAADNKQFTFIPVFQQLDAASSAERGVITASLIDHYVDTQKEAIYYICGSLRMVQAIQVALNELGISPLHIKMEDFPGY